MMTIHIDGEEYHIPSDNRVDEEFEDHIKDFIHEIDGVNIKIAEDGEIQAKGPNIMKGYFNDEESTKEVLTDDGWFSTGDIGEIDQDGFLKITEKIKG